MMAKPVNACSMAVLGRESHCHTGRIGTASALQRIAPTKLTGFHCWTCATVHLKHICAFVVVNSLSKWARKHKSAFLSNTKRILNFWFMENEAVCFRAPVRIALKQSGDGHAGCPACKQAALTVASCASHNRTVNMFWNYQISQQQSRKVHRKGNFTKNFAFANIQSSARTTDAPNVTDLKLNLLHNCWWCRILSPHFCICSQSCRVLIWLFVFRQPGTFEVT